MPDTTPTPALRTYRYYVLGILPTRVTFASPSAAIASQQVRPWARWLLRPRAIERGLAPEVTP